MWQHFCCNCSTVSHPLQHFIISKPTSLNNLSAQLSQLCPLMWAPQCCVRVHWQWETREKRRGGASGYILFNQGESVNCSKIKLRRQKHEDFKSSKVRVWPTHLNSLFGGLLKNAFREGPPLFYEVTKENTFAEEFIKCGKEEKPPSQPSAPKTKEGNGAVTQAHQQGLIYLQRLHKHADGHSDGLGRGYPSQAAPR